VSRPSMRLAGFQDLAANDVGFQRLEFGRDDVGVDSVCFICEGFDGGLAHGTDCIAAFELVQVIP
jgi:hypothetical protein